MRIYSCSKNPLIKNCTSKEHERVKDKQLYQQLQAQIVWKKTLDCSTSPIAPLLA